MNTKKQAPGRATPRPVINLATGLDLLVRDGYSKDPTTPLMVERCKALFDRAEHVTEIKESVETLLSFGDDGWEGLSAILECTGWLNNFVECSCERNAKGIIALLDTCDDDSIIDVREVAEREAGRVFRAHHSKGGAS